MTAQAHHFEPVDEVLDAAMLILVGIIRHQDPVADFYGL
jgi:hypothetical protein